MQHGKIWPGTSDPAFIARRAKVSSSDNRLLDGLVVCKLTIPELTD